MTTFTIPAYDFTYMLGTAALFAEKESALPVLGCVWLEGRGDGWITATATNRYILGCVRHRLADKQTPTFRALIPSQQVKTLTTWFGETRARKGHPPLSGRKPLTLAFAGTKEGLDGTAMTVRGDAWLPGMSKAIAMDSTFEMFVPTSKTSSTPPSTLKVWPFDKPQPGAPVRLNAARLETIAKAMARHNDGTRSGASIALHGPTNPASFVSADGNLIAAIMPVRATDNDNADADGDAASGLPADWRPLISKTES